MDSGGLGKEFFLLLSQQASLYMGPKFRGWMVAVAGEGRDGFFFSHSSSSSSGSSGSGSSKGDGNQLLSMESIAALEGLPEFSEAAFIRFFGRLLGKAGALVLLSFVRSVANHLCILLLTGHNGSSAGGCGALVAAAATHAGRHIRRRDDSCGQCLQEG